MQISLGARRVSAPLWLAGSLLAAGMAPAQAQTNSHPEEIIVTGVPHQRAPGPRHVVGRHGLKTGSSPFSRRHQRSDTVSVTLA